jgi:serine/threonine-protein kinase
VSTEVQAALPKPGALVAGRFRVERIIGLGGMGGVLAAEDVSRGGRVALKLMLPHLTANPEFVGRFAREAAAAAALQTPHVARVLEVGQTPEGAPFIVMELLEGRDLDQTVRACGPLQVAEAVGYVLEACHAIAEAHARGIVHRDLKPGNLFIANVGGRSMLKVLDFGISKTTPLDGGSGDVLTATDTTLGSPQYMSPEQIRSSKRVDWRTDLWSLGIILHKLLTGRLAFQAESIGAHLIMVVNDPPTPLREVRPDAPADLERVILRCLQKDLSLRFQNVGQLALALAPFADPSRHALLDAILATTGRDAALAPLPPLPELEPDAPTIVGTEAALLRSSAALAAAPVPDAGTAPGWTPGQATAPPRRGLYLGAVLGSLAVAAVALAALVATLRSARPATASAATSPMSTSAAVVAPASTPSTPSASSVAGQPPAAEARVLVETDPPDAEVEIDGVVVPDRPLRLPRRDKAYRLVVRAAGYVSESRELTPQSEAAVRVVLKKAGQARKKVLLETNL